MRILKPLLILIGAIAAIFAGLVAAVAVAVSAVIFLLGRKVFKSSRATAPRPTSSPSPRKMPGGDTIDVVATEVPAEADRLTR